MTPIIFAIWLLVTLAMGILIVYSVMYDQPSRLTDRAGPILLWSVITVLLVIAFITI